MNMKAIVYTSSTGHTTEYAKILGEKTGLPVYALNEALKQLSNGIEIIYLGWLFANGIKGYKKAAKKYNVSDYIKYYNMMATYSNLYSLAQ